MQNENLHILVVEDAEIAQRAARSAIESLGHKVDVAKTGAEAIGCCREQHYDLIFMDLGLPDMDGFTVTETLHNQGNGAKFITPIIALTVHDTEEFKVNTRQVGMSDFIAKPLTTEKIEEVIKLYARR